MLSYRNPSISVATSWRSIESSPFFGAPVLQFRSAGSNASVLVTLNSTEQATLQTQPPIAQLAPQLQQALFHSGAIISVQEWQQQHNLWKQSVLPGLRRELVRDGIAVLKRQILPPAMISFMRSDVLRITRRMAGQSCSWIKAPPSITTICSSLNDLVSDCGCSIVSDACDYR